jgi:hypothetical protein
MDSRPRTSKETTAVSQPPGLAPFQQAQLHYLARIRERLHTIARLLWIIMGATVTTALVLIASR